MHNEAVMLKTGFSFKKTGREQKELLAGKTRGGNISSTFFLNKLGRSEKVYVLGNKPKEAKIEKVKQEQMWQLGYGVDIFYSKDGRISL